MIIKSEFKPAWWLTNTHAQTMYSSLFRTIKPPINQSERVELPDGDFVDLIWADHHLARNTPLVVLLHGLGGNMNSTYAAGLMQRFNHCGWRAVLMHFRGSGEEPNRLARAYHSGDTADLNYIMHRLAEQEPETPKAVVGISLGGNVLLKWLGEIREQHLVNAAVAVSVPFQLQSVANKLGRGFSRVYQQYLLKRLKKLFNRKIMAMGNEIPVELQHIDRLRCFWTFDEQVTAPLHGFPHVHAYYLQASSRRYLQHIKTPTLIIQAYDDPFMTPEIIPSQKELSASVILELSKQGGHVGFISGQIPGKPIYWLEQRIPQYLAAYLSNGSSNELISS